MHPSKLGFHEVIGVLLFVVFVYMGLFLGFVSTTVSMFVKPGNSKVWGSEGGAWDHPEPNYALHPYVAEFYAVSTALPFAGGLLLYQALRFDYNWRVLVLALLDCWMYSCAFFAHLTLWPLLNCVTLTSVMTNSLFTFACYSWLAGLRSLTLRLILTALLWSAVAYLVATLPDWFGEKGGVPALLTIQTPAVLCAVVGAVYTQQAKSRPAFSLLIRAGILLASAMAVSLVEVLWGTWLQEHYFGTVPLLHIIIHTLEQIGIYLYGVGVATLQHKTVGPTRGAELVWLGGWFPYLAITSKSRKIE